VTRLVAGRLVLLGVVGAGSQGAVRRAWDLRTRRHVVVKPAGDTAVPRIDHAHVLPQERVGDLVVAPFVPGGSLEQRLASYGALPADLVTVLLDQLLDALGAVHAAGWVHRDVKPGNLLLDAPRSARPHLWLADLGSARPTGTVGPPDGTPGYVPPEACTPTHALPTHDLYAAGVTAAELLAGRPPRTRRELARSPLRPLVRALTDPEPTRRPGSAAAARARLPTITAQRP
jgi:eukaryotic-like serine/threonine-protein kinase